MADKLEKMTRLLAVLALRGIEKEQDKIELLDALGFRPVDTARLLNKSPENVSVVLSNIRKKKAPVTPKTGVQSTSSAPAPVQGEGS